MPRDAMPIDPEPMDLPLKWWVVKRCGTGSGPRHPTCEYGIIEATTRFKALHRLVRMTGTGLTVDLTACGPFDTEADAVAACRGAQRPEDFTARDDVEVLPDEVAR